MVGLTDDYSLRSIGCRRSDGEETGDVDLDEQRVVLRVEPAASIACIFRVRAELPSGGASPGGATDSDEGDFSEPDAQEGDQSASTSLDWVVPLAGRWKAINKPGVADCGAVSTKLKRTVDQGRIQVRDAGRLLVGRGIGSGQGEPLRLRLVDADTSLYEGTVRISDSGATTRMVFSFNAITPKRLEGSLTATSNAGGQGCVVVRDITLRHTGN